MLFIQPAQWIDRVSSSNLKIQFSALHASTFKVKANISRPNALLTHGDYDKMFEENKKVMKDNFQRKIGKIIARFDNKEGRKVMKEILFLLLYLMMS